MNVFWTFGNKATSAFPALPLDIVMFEALSQACLHGNVGRTPVWVAADAVYDWLGGLSLQWKRLIERTKLEGILGKPVHGVLLWRHLKQPGSHSAMITRSSFLFRFPLIIFWDFFIHNTNLCRFCDIKGLKELSGFKCCFEKSLHTCKRVLNILCKLECCMISLHDLCIRGKVQTYINTTPYNILDVWFQLWRSVKPSYHHCLMLPFRSVTEWPRTDSFKIKGFDSVEVLCWV